LQSARLLATVAELGSLGRMNRLPLFIAVILVGCADRYPYSGTLADAERAISTAALGLTHLAVEARGDTWIRYRVVHDTSGIYITNGAATVRVEGGPVAVSGPARVREAIRDSLKVK
jgi:hypothetical protein